jgi:hypothetical protein
MLTPFPRREVPGADNSNDVEAWVMVKDVPGEVLALKLGSPL